MGTCEITVAIQHMKTRKTMMIPYGFLAWENDRHTRAGDARLIGNNRRMTHSHTCHIGNRVVLSRWEHTDIDAQIT